MDLSSRYSGVVGSLDRLDAITDQMLSSSSSDFIASPRKTASGNSYKYLSTIQRSDQQL
jgi:hypothetical protein